MQFPIKMSGIKDRKKMTIVVVAFLSGALRVSHYVHPHLHINKYRYSPLGERTACTCDHFQLPHKVGSHAPSSEDFISLSGECFLCQELTVAEDNPHTTTRHNHLLL